MSIFRKKINSLSDEEIIQSYQLKGDLKYVGVLYERYSHLILGLSLKYLKNMEESEDMVMKIFEKLTKDLMNHEVQNFKSWVFTVSRNHCLMFLRKQSRMAGKVKSIDGMDVHVDDSHEKEQKIDTEIKLSQMEAAMDQLKPEHKSCVELFYLQEKCYQEVSEITGFSMKQVKSYIQNGRRNLKIIMEKG